MWQQALVLAVMAAVTSVPAGGVDRAQVAPVSVAQVSGAQASVPQRAPAGSPVANNLRADFNGDGFDDLAVGVPGEDVGSAEDAGEVDILPGSADGPTGTGSMAFTQNTAGVVSSAEDGDFFGDAVAAADFNNDGFADLAIGASFERGSGAAGGAVNVLSGSATGLTGTGSALFTQDTAGVGGTSEDLDGFGQSLAVGDFDHDGFADLAIGVPTEDVNAAVDAGAVTVLRGSAGGLTTSGSRTFTQNSAGLDSSAEDGDNFGFALVAGDFDDDTFADLAIGVPFESGATATAGAVAVLHGTADGLTGTGSMLLTQNTSGIGSNSENGDLFGFALVSGQFSSDGFVDLAVGVPGEDVGTGDRFAEDGGAVNVLPGSASGLNGTGSTLLTQSQPGVISTSEDGDNYGFALAAGNFTSGPGVDTLVVGVPGEDVFAVRDAGAVNVVVRVLTPQGAPYNMHYFHQDTPGVPSSAERDDAFGLSLVAGEFKTGSVRDLVVGVPLEDIGTASSPAVDGGAVIRFRGFRGGPHGEGAGLIPGALLNQNSSGVPGAGESGDIFGDSLATRK